MYSYYSIRNGKRSYYLTNRKPHNTINNTFFLFDLILFILIVIFLFKLCKIFLNNHIKKNKNNNANIKSNNNKIQLINKQNDATIQSINKSNNVAIPKSINHKNKDEHPNISTIKYKNTIKNYDPYIDNYKILIKDDPSIQRNIYSRYPYVEYEKWNYEKRFDNIRY